MFTNDPWLVEKTEIHPGMSDHNVVITDINIKAKICKKQPRNVYIYKNVDMDLSQTFTDHLNDSVVVPVYIW
jgi:hypothetical protein